MAAMQPQKGDLSPPPAFGTWLPGGPDCGGWALAGWCRGSSDPHFGTPFAALDEKRGQFQKNDL